MLGATKTELFHGRVTEKIKRTQNTESFRVKLSEQLNFSPGQFLQVIFDKDNLNNKELNKYLSFSSSPAKYYIEFTKKLSESAFSQKLKTLETGSEVLIKAPMGNCVFNEEYKKISFLIGGIGITPVISIIEYIVDKKLDTDVVLLYSNRTVEDIAFRKELDSWQKINKNVKVVYMVTDCEPKDSKCIFGAINKSVIQEKISDLKERVCFIFGPPKMVDAMKNLSIEAGCAKENTKTENFIGY